ncbi:hypothetical protein BH11PLA2_BH11PLA2_43860 [soil metagenome]
MNLSDKCLGAFVSATVVLGTFFSLTVPYFGPPIFKRMATFLIGL